MNEQAMGNRQSVVEDGRKAHSLRWALVVGLVAGVLHSAAFAAAFPPVDWWFTGLLSLVVLVLICPPDFLKLKSRKASLGLGVGVWLGSVLGWGWLMHWVSDVSAAGVVPLVAHMAMYPALAVLLTRFVCLRLGWPTASLFVFACVWAALEVVRGELLWGGFPWYLIGQTFIDRGAGGLADVLGPYGVVPVLLGCFAVWGVLIAHLRRVRQEQGEQVATMLPVFLTAGLAMLPMLMLIREMPASSAVEPSGDVVHVGVIQTNVPQDNRQAWTFEQRADALLEIERLVLQANDEAIEQGVQLDLIILPETMYPGFFGFTQESADMQREAELGIVVFHDRMRALQRLVDVPLVVGASAYEGLTLELLDNGAVQPDADEIYNSVYLVDGGQISDTRYDKMHLTPFGEVMPLISRWDWLEEKLLAVGAQGMAFDLDAGTEHTRFAISRVPGSGRGKFAAPICFEGSMPKVVRPLVFERGQGGIERKARLLLNLTNDGWFGEFDGGREAHLLTARWTAAQLRTPMVRAANTGVSCVIDAKGRVVAQLPAQQEGVLVASVELADVAGVPVYARFGAWPGWLCLWASVGMILWSAFAPAAARQSGTKQASSEEQEEQEQPADQEGQAT